MNRGRHKKKKELTNNQKIEKLLKTIKENEYSYRARIEYYKNGKPDRVSTSILRFYRKEEILKWFCNLKFFLFIDTITIDKITFKL